MKGYDLTSNFFNKKNRKYDSYKGLVGKIAPNRFHRKFKTDRPYQKLVTDVSEFRYGSKNINERVYLSPVMDLYSDEILSFNISSHPTVSFTLKSLKDALESISGQGHRIFVHSDQGFQYQSYRWRKTLKHFRVYQSMSRKGTCLDNAQMESFFHLMKAEMNDKNYETKDELIKAMKSWIEYYNNIRIKTKLGGKSPVQYRKLTA